MYFEPKKTLLMALALICCVASKQIIRNEAYLNVAIVQGVAMKNPENAAAHAIT